jgi:hypothetical protein
MVCEIEGKLLYKEKGDIQRGEGVIQVMEQKCIYVSF